MSDGGREQVQDPESGVGERNPQKNPLPEAE